MTVSKVLLVDTMHLQKSEINKLLGKDSKKVFHLTQPRPLPLGLMYVGSYLQQAIPSLDIKILDLNNLCNVEMDDNFFLENDLDAFLEKHFMSCLELFRPDVVGLQYLFSSSYEYVMELARRAKNFDSTTHVTVGGNAATVSSLALVDSHDIDSVIRGEGELPMVSLARHLLGEDVELRGVVTKERRILDVNLVEDLDTMPFPDYNQLIIGKEWHFNQIGWGRITYPDEWQEPDVTYRSAAFLHSRGCPYQCIFCASSLVHGKKVRERSVENVREELTHLRDTYGINRVLANDDTFNFEKKRTLAILKVIADLDMELVLPNNISMRVLDDEICEAFKKTRTKSLHIAIESGNQRIQDQVMKKLLDLDDIRRKVELLRRHNFWVRAYWILGLPGEDLETINDTIQFSASLPVDWNVFHMATPLMGTRMFEMAQEQGLLHYDSLADIHYENLAMDVLAPTGKSVRDAYEFANISVNFLRNYNMLHGDYARAAGAFWDVLKCYPFHAVGWSCLRRCYEGLGDSQGVARAEAGLKQALENEEGRKVYEKYVLGGQAAEAFA